MNIVGVIDEYGNEEYFRFEEKEIAEWFFETMKLEGNKCVLYADDMIY